MPKWNNSYHPLSYLCSYYCFWELLSSESYYYLILLKIPFVFLKKKKGFFVLVISGDGCYFIDIYLTSLSFTPSLPCSILSLHASPLRTTQTPTAPPPAPRTVGFHHLSLSLHVFHRPISPLRPLPELLSHCSPSLPHFVFFLSFSSDQPLICYCLVGQEFHRQWRVILLRSRLTFLWLSFWFLIFHSEAK